MAQTADVTLTPEWTEIVDDDTADFFLSLPFDSTTTVLVAVWATTGAEDSIDVLGHPLRGERIDSINRSVIGEGYVYAKCPAGSTTVALTK
jgi:hypothetical protein